MANYEKRRVRSEITEKTSTELGVSGAISTHHGCKSARTRHIDGIFVRVSDRRIDASVVHQSYRTRQGRRKDKAVARGAVLGKAPKWNVYCFFAGTRNVSSRNEVHRPFIVFCVTCVFIFKNILETVLSLYPLKVRWPILSVENGTSDWILNSRLKRLLG